MPKDGIALALDSTHLITTMFALVPIPVAIVDDRGRIVLSNSTFTDVFQGLPLILSESQREIEILGRGTYQLQTLPLNDQGYRMIFATEVSDQVHLRKQVTHLEKMAAIGRVVTGVAHELSTPLADIANCALAAERSNLQPDVRHMIGSVLTKAERASYLVKNLMVLAGIAAPRRVSVDINDIVLRIIEQRGSRQQAKNFNVTLDIDSNLPKTIGDPSQLEQVVFSLIVNAEDSIAALKNRPGSIQIRTCGRNGRIQLHVADNGFARQASQIFEPHEGGVGLNLCAEIVKDHGGELYAWSSYGSGATLTLEMPVLMSEDIETSPDIGECLRGKDVMVVDDDVHITEFVHDVLERYGARVQIANSGTEAYERIRKEPFDLIVCDQHMPGLSGQSLYRLIESGGAGPRKFLFVTGDIVTPGTRQFFARNGVHFLRKPFKIQELIEAVDQLLGQK